MKMKLKKQLMNYYQINGKNRIEIEKIKKEV